MPRDDADVMLDAWRFLAEPDSQDLIKAASASSPGDVAAVARLRRNWSQTQVVAALELCEARRRAHGKFDDPEQLYADREGLEQATGSIIARYKTNRLADAGVTEISDLCCGIGGDAMALAARMDVTGFDRDPVKAWMTGKNASCQTRCEDILESTIPAGPVHIDPARRSDTDGTRRHDPSDWIPSADSLQTLLAAHPDAVVKMGPGINQDDLVFRRDGDEVEFISLEGKLLQAVLWTGRFAREARRATRCGTNEILSIEGHEADPPPVQPTDWSGAWLHVPDPALERAELLGVLCREWNLYEPAAGLGLLVGETPADTPWLTPYQVVDHMPWRPARIKAWLKSHDAGIIELRTRGKAIVDVDRLRQDFRGGGSTPWTIFGLRLGLERVAVMTLPRGQSSLRG
ncbi:MAG: hypothetical protein MK116_13705 [Phycisphaerales bacterium]|nr:hypothetical protein [Phycisphaerales bacterium]